MTGHQGQRWVDYAAQIKAGQEASESYACKTTLQSEIQFLFDMY